MADPTPTFDQVIAAVLAEMTAMSPLPGTILHFENHLENEAELIKRYLLSPPQVEAHVWMISGSQSPDVEGDAVGQVFCTYNVQLRYVSVMTAVDTWSRTALTRAERVRNTLSKNANVFAISGQRQLRTAETVELAGADFTIIGDQRVYQVTLRLQVEARRWS